MGFCNHPNPDPEPELLIFDRQAERLSGELSGQEIGVSHGIPHSEDDPRGLLHTVSKASSTQQ